MFAVIFISDFSLQAVLRHEPELFSKPVALVDPGSSKTNIVQLNPAARACGVCEGQTPSQAAARCAELKIKARSFSQEESAAGVLLQTAYAFSPFIESTAPGLCTMELKGLPLDSNSASAEQWASKIVQALAPLHLSARIGIALTPALALLAAREARPLLLVQTSADFLSTLPVAALEPDLEISKILNLWGIYTV